MKNKKGIFIRIISIIILLSLPIIYLMDELYFFSESNKRYTIGVYYKDGFYFSIHNQLLLNNLQVISQKYGRNL